MGVSSPMYKTRSKQGQDCSNMSKIIVNQDIEGRLGYCANGPIGVILPMSKTRSKLGSEGNCRD